jgi:hypothetical protein
MIGPSIAGIIMGAFGVSSCFLINSLSFLAVLISLFFIHPIACETVQEKDEQGVLPASAKDSNTSFTMKRSLPRCCS